MKTFNKKVENKKERRTSRSWLKFSTAVSSLLLLFFLINRPYSQVDNASIQLTKIEFSKILCEDGAVDIVKSVKEIQGVKTAVCFLKTNAQVASFDNRVLRVSAVAVMINDIYSGGLKIISNKDFINVRGFPLDKSNILLYIFNFF